MDNSFDEINVLTELEKKEDLLEKKAKIYSRLLTDTTLAQDMETVAVRHAERKKAIGSLIGRAGGKV